MPRISVEKKSMTDAAGKFYYGVTYSFPFGFPEYRYIAIDPENTNFKTIAHGYGHYVTYQMWGREYSSMANTSSQMAEGWAIFYSFAVVNYAHKVYGDDFFSYGNLEESPFDSPRFRYVSYYGINPKYWELGCYLWNLYGGSDGVFKSSKYIGDNDDINGCGQRVFDIMKGYG